MKRKVPDLHTDFAASVGAEEFGLVFLLLVISLFAFVVVRGLQRAMKLSDPFEQVAAAGLFVLLGAEFLAMILVVVYVGAVLVLFLFVVMMLDVDFAALKAGFLKYLPIGATIGLLLLVELILIVGAWVTAPDAVARSAVAAKGSRSYSTRTA